jgi:hypothetical protein
MKLSTQDGDLFFKLMWSLQTYVNLKLEILPGIDTIEEYQMLPTSDKFVVRDALYENIGLIDSYLEENPQDLSKEELEIVESWKKFQRDDFFIERLLKKYAVFIGGEKVYGVLALHETFDEVLPYARLPYYVKAVLLPFKGKMIYDGLLNSYAISFGGGIKSDLKETYMAAKQNGKIIESFDPQKQAELTARGKKPVKDYGPTLEEISQQAKKLRSSSDAPAIHGPAFGLVKASIEFATLAVDNPDDIDQLWKKLKKVDGALRKLETVLFRAEYY